MSDCVSEYTRCYDGARKVIGCETVVYPSVYYHDDPSVVEECVGVLVRVLIVFVLSI